ncbi:DUF3299 domain-containing protein [Aquincola sp. MAHUQ-54]|uniref:DUF3299 domain-containing protein n=1 Tax=Aquincola agrisoli TaxID=3119538 RepID=A0AAW9QDE3_9BURK
MSSLSRRSLLSIAFAATAPAAFAAPPGGEYRTITWEALVPKDWDPSSQFKDAPASLQDGDPRAVEMLNKLREVWNNAPANSAMQNAAVRLPGYVVPLEEANGGITEFLLVPYFGACIHTPPPPANQIVHVLPKAPLKQLKSMDAVWVRGKLQLSRTDSAMGTSGYRMEAVSVDKYVADEDAKKR